MSQNEKPSATIAIVVHVLAIANFIVPFAMLAGLVISLFNNNIHTSSARSAVLNAIVTLILLSVVSIGLQLVAPSLGNWFLIITSLIWGIAVLYGGITGIVNAKGGKPCANYPCMLPLFGRKQAAT